MIIIHNTSQVIPLTANPQRGSALGTLNAIEHGAVAIEDGKIIEVGAAAVLLERYPQAEKLDAQGGAVLPGFVDPHTHLVWAGNRAAEFEMRLQGKTYMEIMAAGGGIASTVSETRRVSLDELIAQSHQRALAAFGHGSTTIEAKTGYGLDLDTEFKQLEAIFEMNRLGPYELVPTYMGAHAIPTEFKGDTAGFVDFLVETALPEVKNWWLVKAEGQALPFVDVFCEQGVFDIDQTRRILCEARELGFALKLHADEFVNLGGAALAAELGATSADHLVKTSLDDIRAMADSETVAVSLPGTPFSLAQSEYTPAKQIIAADGYLALATDLNPGTTWNESMQMIQALACRYMKLTPAQALSAATINSAKAVSREAQIGSLTSGKQADLLILSTPDYRDLSYRYGANLVRTVIKRGQVW
ncbi:MAG: imidazolonepropionase [Chloroflexi bacterium]|nr:imidazolonepropionase [Chloroflexota bacterium]